MVPGLRPLSLPNTHSVCSVLHLSGVLDKLELSQGAECVSGAALHSSALKHCHKATRFAFFQLLL